jgi:hypothetical protein
MGIDYVAFQMNKDDFPGPKYHPYFHFMFREQSSCFAMFLGHQLKSAEISPALGKSRTGVVLVLRDHATSQILAPFPTKYRTWLLEELVSIDELAAVPFEMTELPISQQIRAAKPDREPWMAPKYSTSALSELLHKITFRAFERWQEFLGVDPQFITEVYERFKNRGHVYSWVKPRARCRLKELNANVELVNELTSWSLTKRLVISRKGEVIDSRVVYHHSPERHVWIKTMDKLSVDNGEIVIGNGTWRYRPFGELRTISFQTDNESEGSA